MGKMGRTWQTWQDMKQRCNNSKNKDYHRYGGRGIKVCERWLTYHNFLADMGERPLGLTLDRRDNDGDYKKSNCRWTTLIDNCQNQERSRYLEFKGEKLTLSAWARKLGINKSVVYARLSYGYPIEKVLSKESFRNRSPL